MSPSRGCLTGAVALRREAPRCLHQVVTVSRSPGVTTMSGLRSAASRASRQRQKSASRGDRRSRFQGGGCHDQQVATSNDNDARVHPGRVAERDHIPRVRFRKETFRGLRDGGDQHRHRVARRCDARSDTPRTLLPYETGDIPCCGCCPGLLGTQIPVRHQATCSLQRPVPRDSLVAKILDRFSAVGSMKDSRQPAPFGSSAADGGPKLRSGSVRPCYRARRDAARCPRCTSRSVRCRQSTGQNAGGRGLWQSGSPCRGRQVSRRSNH